MITIKKENKNLFESIKKASKLLDAKNYRYFLQYMYSDGSGLFFSNGTTIIRINSSQNIPASFYSCAVAKNEIILIPVPEHNDSMYPDTSDFFNPTGDMLFNETLTKDSTPSFFCKCLNKFYQRTNTPIAFDYNHLQYLLLDQEYSVYIEDNTHPIKFLSDFYSVALMPFRPENF